MGRMKEQWIRAMEDAEEWAEYEFYLELEKKKRQEEETRRLEEETEDVD